MNFRDFEEARAEDSDDKTIRMIHIRTQTNVRTEVGDFSELMNSIRQNGLLQPIGLWKKGKNEYAVVWGNRRITALKKLGVDRLRIGREAVLLDSQEMTEDKYLVMNTIENIQRKEVSPVELGKIAVELKNRFGLSVSEVAARLAVSYEKVGAAIDLYRKVPKEYREDVGYVHGREDKKGAIGAEVMRRALLVPLKKSDQKILLDAVKSEEMTADEVSQIRGLVESGASIREAIERRKEYHRVHLTITVKIAVAQRVAKERNASIPKLLQDSIAGKVRLPDGFVYHSGE